jgi:spore coat protein U-like protein
VEAGLYLSEFTAAHTTFIYGLNLAPLIACDAIPLLTTTINPTFTVSANVETNCELAAADIDFGSHGALAGAVSATGQLGVRCTPDAGFAIALGNGNTGTGPTAREMTLGPNAITYGLYSDAGHTQPWGESGGTTIAGTGSGLEQLFTIYGRVPPQPTPPPGTYSDTIVVTVTY